MYKYSAFAFVLLLAGMAGCKKEIRSVPADSGFIVYGDQFNTSISDVISLKDGGFLLIGQQSIGGYFNQNTKDGWVVRTDQNGSIKWSRTYGGPRMDWFYSGVELSDGSLVICGLTASQGTAMKTAGSQIGDGWIVKLTAQGEIIWSKSVAGGTTGGQLNGIYEDMFLDISPTSYGTFLVSGLSSSFKDTGKSLPPGVSSAAWLTELDDTGQLIWEIGYKSTMNDDAESFNKVYQRPGRIITGHNAASFTVGDPKVGFIVWKTTGPGQKPDFDFSGYHVQTGVNTIVNSRHWAFPQDNGDFYITGYEPDRPDSMYLLKFNSTGTEEFYRFLNVPGLVRFNGARDMKEGFIIVGEYRASYADLATPIVVYTDKEGRVQWHRIIPQNANAEAVTIIPDNRGNLNVFGNLQDATNGTYDGFLLRLNMKGEIIK